MSDDVQAVTDDAAAVSPETIVVNFVDVLNLANACAARNGLRPEPQSIGAQLEQAPKDTRVNQVLDTLAMLAGFKHFGRSNAFREFQVALNDQ